MTAATMREAFASAEPIDIWPAPDMTLVDNGRRPAARMPSAMFGPAWSIIEQVAECTSTAPDYAAMGYLASAASLIGGKRRVSPYGSDWSEPCILWCAALGEPREVSKRSVAAAITWVEDYAKPMAARVYGDAAVPEVDRNAALLARYVRRTGLDRLNLRELRRTPHKSHLKPLQAKGALEDAIDLLENAGWVRADPHRDGDKAGYHLSSDEMDPTKPAGWSKHGDYLEAWDPEVKRMWEVDGCIDAHLNCASGGLGNGLRLRAAAQPFYNGAPSWTNPRPAVPVPPRP